MSLPNPVKSSDFYLAAILEKLEEIRCAVIAVEAELQKLNNSAIQKTTVQMDVKQLADRLIAEIQKGPMTRKPTK